MEANDFYKVDNMNLFPSIWELDCDEVVKRKFQSKNEDFCHLIPEGAQIDHFLFEEDQLPGFQLDNFAEKLMAGDEDAESAKESKTHESTKTTTTPRQKEKSLADEVFAKKRRGTSTKKDVKDSVQKNPKVPTKAKKAKKINFNARVRFTKEHDRGKYCCSAILEIGKL